MLGFCEKLILVHFNVYIVTKLLSFTIVSKVCNNCNIIQYISDSNVSKTTWIVWFYLQNTF